MHKKNTHDAGSVYGSVLVMYCTREVDEVKHKKYRITRTCCGDELIVTHRQLTDWRKKPPSMCFKCRYGR